jgi:hypothetical protein
MMLVGISSCTHAEVQKDFSQNFVPHKFETRHTIIHYESIEDLKTFNRKIDYPAAKWGILSSLIESNSDNLHDNVSKKVDAIFEKAQHLLGMRQRMDKVKIHICDNRKQLNQKYYEFYGRPSRFRAWYVYELNAIYLSLNDLDEGMLSHELAHAIIDHYLLVRPPRASAEILATYVDVHLFD